MTGLGAEGRERAGGDDGGRTGGTKHTALLGCLRRAQRRCQEGAVSGRHVSRAYTVMVLPPPLLSLLKCWSKHSNCSLMGTDHRKALCRAGLQGTGLPGEGTIRPWPGRAERLANLTGRGGKLSPRRVNLEAAVGLRTARFRNGAERARITSSKDKVKALDSRAGWAMPQHATLAGPLQQWACCFPSQGRLASPRSQSTRGK